jgi:hypothetical protein
MRPASQDADQQGEAERDRNDAGGFRPDRSKHVSSRFTPDHRPMDVDPAAPPSNATALAAWSGNRKATWHRCAKNI